MIFLIRHGEEDNTRLGGWSDTALSSKGIEQVKSASENIAKDKFVHFKVASAEIVAV